MGVSKNRGTPKSSILIGFSIIYHPFWVPLFLETPIFKMYWFPTIRVKSIKSANRQSPARPQQRLFFFKKNTSNQNMANPRLPNTLGLEVFGPQKHPKNTEPQEV